MAEPLMPEMAAAWDTNVIGASTGTTWGGMVQSGNVSKAKYASATDVLTQVR